MKTQWIVLLLVASGCMPQVRASDIRCPAFIEDRAQLTKAPTGWEPFLETGRRPLERVSIYLFHPREKASQVPDSTSRKGVSEEDLWTFTPGPKDEYWVGCSYLGTSALLTQKLPKTVTQCVAVYKVTARGERESLTRLSCK